MPDRQINAVQADGGAVAIGDGARAIKTDIYIENQTVIQQRARQEPNLFQVFLPRMRAGFFVGRDAELARMCEELSAVNVQPLGLCGMGGNGKTQLAIEYAYRRRADYPDGVFWINAQNAQEWSANLVQVARRLALEVPEPDQPDADARLIAALSGYLNGHPSALVIFDNVDDPARLIESPVPGFTPAALQCRMLFTTRHRFSHPALQLIDIGVLSPDAALAVLLRDPARQLALDPTHEEHASAVRLCERLGFSPLALSLAAAYLARFPRVTVSGYLVRVQAEGALNAIQDAGAGHTAVSAGHDPPVTATLRLQWNALTDPGARRLLETIGLLNQSQSIPRRFLELVTGLSSQAKPGYASPMDEGLASAGDLSLLDELANGDVRVHPLVREFCATQIQDRDGLRNQVLEGLAAAFLAPDHLDAIMRVEPYFATYSLRLVEALLPREDTLSPSTSSGEGIVSRLMVRLTGPRAARDNPRPDAQRLSADLRAAQEAFDMRRGLIWSIHDWNPDAEPALFLQQWRNRCHELGWTEQTQRTELLLSGRRGPFLRLVRKWETHQGLMIKHLAFSPNGQQLVWLDALNNSTKVIGDFQ